MNVLKLVLAGALGASTLMSAGNAAAVAPSPDSVVYFRQLWDNAMLFAYRGQGAFAQSVCDVYRSQVWPDPGANEVVPLLHYQCRVSVVNIVVHHTNPLPFPLR